MVLYIEGKRVPAVKDKVGAAEANAESDVSQSPAELKSASSPPRPSKAKRAPLQKRSKSEDVPAGSKPESARKKVKPKASRKWGSSKADQARKPDQAGAGDDEVHEKMGEAVAGPDRAQPDIQARVLRLAFEKLLAHPEIQVMLGQPDAKESSVSHVIEQILTEALGKAAVSRAAARQELLNKIHLNAAGLDIGAEEIWVCVPDGRDEKAVRMFKTFMPDLYALADWLKQCGIDTVAMESTGVYWIPIYDILEAQGVKVYLVNARHIKNVSGRKTDVLDCQPAWRQTGGFKPCTRMGCCKPHSGRLRTSARYGPMCDIGTT